MEGIFESFHQADSTHTRQFLGTGLGLTISGQMVELHNGKIWLTSEVGNGTLVFVNLPKSGPFQIHHRESDPTEKIHAGGNTVVVVDDNPEDLRLAGEILEERGFDVSLINDSTQAIFRIQEEQPRVVILDVLMPDLDGISLLKRLRELKDFANTPILVSSAFHASKGLVQEYGGIWLAKPWNPDELTTLIARHAPSHSEEL
jgi:CheY-like chemotaxis protein